MVSLTHCKRNVHWDTISHLSCWQRGKCLTTYLEVSQLLSYSALSSTFLTLGFASCSLSASSIRGTRRSPQDWKREEKLLLLLFSRSQLCNPMDCSTPGFPVRHYHPQCAQTHVHWVDDAIQPPHPPWSPSPSAPHCFLLVYCSREDCPGCWLTKLVKAQDRTTPM